MFEVFGPVVSPYYSIRINQQNESTRVYDVDSVVYFVSNDSTLTYYVFPDSMEKWVFSMQICDGFYHRKSSILDTATSLVT